MGTEAQLKQLVTDKDGTLSLHKLGNLIAQGLAGVAVGYGYFVFHMPITYIYIYLGIISGNGVMLKAAEYIDQSTGKDFGVTMSKYHKMFMDIFGQVNNALEGIQKQQDPSASGTNPTKPKQGTTGTTTASKSDSTK